MVFQDTFKFILNNHSLEQDKIFQAMRHDGVYDIYVINGLEFHRERVASLVENGEWVIV